MIGWYGKPGEFNAKAKTHIVRNGGPICGCRPSGEFQWCSSDDRSYTPECLHCQKINNELAGPTKEVQPYDLL
jgi:hypothetical protein